MSVVGILVTFDVKSICNYHSFAYQCVIFAASPNYMLTFKNLMKPKFEAAGGCRDSSKSASVFCSDGRICNSQKYFWYFTIPLSYRLLLFRCATVSGSLNWYWFPIIPTNLTIVPYKLCACARAHKSWDERTQENLERLYFLCLFSLCSLSEIWYITYMTLFLPKPWPKTSISEQKTPRWHLTLPHIQ